MSNPPRAHLMISPGAHHQLRIVAAQWRMSLKNTIEFLIQKAAQGEIKPDGENHAHAGAIGEGE